MSGGQITAYSLVVGEVMAENAALRAQVASLGRNLDSMAAAWREETKERYEAGIRVEQLEDRVRAHDRIINVARKNYLEAEQRTVDGIVAWLSDGWCSPAIDCAVGKLITGEWKK